MFAIEFHGWAKDMDLYTRDGNTLDPLPAAAGLHGAPPVRRDELHDRYNVRFRGGPLGSLSALDAYPRVAGGRVPESRSLTARGLARRPSGLAAGRGQSR